MANQSYDKNLLSDPSYLEDLRQFMLKFATTQLQDTSLAEDAVQEALTSAFKNVQSFERRSALKTWVFAILKNKIIDILRQRQKLVEASRLDLDEDDMHDLFNERGHWHRHERPLDWNQPLDNVHDEQFWKVMEVCMEKLPATQGKVFMMREVLGLDSAEICEQESLTTSNLHVQLYRARIRLRECLENHWFAHSP